MKEKENTAVRFITVLEGVVTGVHHGDIHALFADPIMNTHERVQVGDGAKVRPLDKTAFYTPEWKRKTDAELVAEGLLTVPAGLKLNAEGAFDPMNREERVIAGLDAPEPGFKVEDGRIVAMTLSEKVAAGLVTEEEYAAIMANEAEAELNRRLALLNTEEAKAMAEVDPEYAAGRKAKMAELLAARKQPGWPLTVEWPGE
jgi:PHD/YefM family antitoxin component YafN of YafNO toxin-antitoxin module